MTLEKLIEKIEYSRDHHMGEVVPLHMIVDTSHAAAILRHLKRAQRMEKALISIQFKLVNASDMRTTAEQALEAKP